MNKYKRPLEAGSRESEKRESTCRLGKRGEERGTRVPEGGLP